MTELIHPSQATEGSTTSTMSFGRRCSSILDISCEVSQVRIHFKTILFSETRRLFSRCVTRSNDAVLAPGDFSRHILRMRSQTSPCDRSWLRHEQPDDRRVLLASDFTEGTLARWFPEQEPEDNTVGDEQEWYQDGWNEVGRTLHARREVNARAIAFVEGMEQVCGAEKVERPDQDDSQFVPQRRDRQQARIAVARSPYAAGRA